MRRRWIWIGTATAVVLALLTAFFAIPHSPYSFLEGRSPVVLTNPSPAKDFHVRWGLDYSLYSFQGDWQILKRQMDRELKDKGFTSSEEGEYPAAGPIVAYTRADKKLLSAAAKGAPTKDLPPTTLVYLYGDSKYLPHRLGRGTPNGELGWVTIEVVSNTHRTPLDRFRDWLGL
jgi:hypothetical protein